MERDKFSKILRHEFIFQIFQNLRGILKNTFIYFFNIQDLYI